MVVEKFISNDVEVRNTERHYTTLSLGSDTRTQIIIANPEKYIRFAGTHQKKNTSSSHFSEDVSPFTSCECRVISLGIREWQKLIAPERPPVAVTKRSYSKNMLLVADKQLNGAGRAYEIHMEHIHFYYEMSNVQIDFDLQTDLCMATFFTHLIQTS
ncbi:hypothetical protein TNCV_646851 [Trichonephila clavipes]|nr:hypothetical protein TNCV_646851 [Trichonephila clavipes]